MQFKHWLNLFAIRELFCISGPKGLETDKILHMFILELIETENKTLWAIQGALWAYNICEFGFTNSKSRIHLKTLIYFEIRFFELNNSNSLKNCTFVILPPFKEFVIIYVLYDHDYQNLSLSSLDTY